MSIRRRIYGLRYIGSRAYLASMTTHPLSSVYGMDRGKPVDRVYVEEFLEAHSDDIRGRCIEIKDATYLR